MFITFEGPEGSGKSTQVGLLTQALRSAGLPVLATREPGGTPLGERIRALLLDASDQIQPEAEAYLMTAARAEHVRGVIGPALRSGQIVVCDRFVDSTLAYQGAGRGLPIAELAALQTLAVGELRPTLTLLLDIDIREGLARRRAAAALNRIDREDLDFHERVGAWFREAARLEPERWVVIDGAAEPQCVQADVYRAVQQRLQASAVSSGEVVST